MVKAVYSHTFDDNWKRVADLMEDKFFGTEKSAGDKKASRYLLCSLKNPN